MSKTISDKELIKKLIAGHMRDHEWIEKAGKHPKEGSMKMSRKIVKKLRGA